MHGFLFEKMIYISCLSVKHCVMFVPVFVKLNIVWTFFFDVWVISIKKINETHGHKNYLSVFSVYKMAEYKFKLYCYSFWIQSKCLKTLCYMIMYRYHESVAIIHITSIWLQTLRDLHDKQNFASRDFGRSLGDKNMEKLQIAEVK